MSATTLKASTQYALTLSATEGSLSDAYYWNGDNTSSSYTGGSTMDSRGGWNPADPVSDAMFQINGGDYKGTLCSLSDAINKAGANASSESTNESLVSDFVKQAEGHICAVSRYNWVKAYSEINEDVKYILNSVASCLAAIDIITYDPSGYTDIVEAETMINVYRESAARGLSLLRNKNVQTFLESE